MAVTADEVIALFGWNGDPKYPPSQEIPDVPYARIGELLGFRGIRVDSPDDLAAALDEAFGAREPTLLEAVVDPEIPPLPPHVSVTELTNMAKAFVKGDPEAPGIARKSLASKLADFVR